MGPRASVLVLLGLAATCGCQARGAAAIPFGTPVHLRSEGHAVAGDVAFTVRLLPKLMVSGPVPEIEQALIECARGDQHAIVQLDTLHKRGECLGVTFELGYADVYHDDVELRVYPGSP